MMIKAKFIAGGIALLLVGFTGGALIKDRAISRSAAEENPFGLPMLSAEEQKAEDDFLRIDLDGSTRKAEAEIAASGVTAATVNEPYRTCTKIPEVQTADFHRGTGEASMRRSLYALERAQHVLATKDCTCAGKVVPWSAVTEREAALRAEHGATWADHKFLSPMIDAARQQTKLAEALCGGDF